MNRRSFLAGAAVVPLNATALMAHGAGSDLTITPDSYHTNRIHQAIADRVLAAARVNREDCNRIVLSGSTATLSVIRRGPDGRWFIDGDELATRDVEISGSFLPWSKEGL
jgi:hypothetical protein